MTSGADQQGGARHEVMARICVRHTRVLHVAPVVQRERPAEGRAAARPGGGAEAPCGPS